MDKSGKRQAKGFPKRSSTIVKKKITSSHIDLAAKESSNSLLEGDGHESSSPVFQNVDSNVQISLLGGGSVHSPLTNKSPTQSIAKQQIQPFSLR
jgi:hypothetical protein